MTLSAAFYNNGLREVGRDGRCSWTQKTWWHLKCFFSAWSEEGKWMGNWMLFCMCLWFYCLWMVCRHAQSSTAKAGKRTVVICRIQVNWAIFVTEISGEKWPNLHDVHVNLRFMRWSHTLHSQDRAAWRCFWRVWVYIEFPATGRMIALTRLPPASMQHSFPYWPVWSWNNPKQQRQKHFQCFPQGLFQQYIFPVRKSE